MDIETNEEVKQAEQAAGEQAGQTAAEQPAAEEAPKKEKSAKQEKARARKAELEKALAEREEYLNALIRERADFENYKRRNAQVVSRAYADGTADAALAMLPVLDNLERALGTQSQDEALRSGVELVLRQLTDALKALGVEEIEALGVEFDPNLHNAVMQCEPEEGDESGKVKEVLMKGYKMKDKVLRHAMVKVVA